MKGLILSLFALASYAHHGGGGGTGTLTSVGGDLGGNGVPVVFPLPIEIHHDGSTEFIWDWWGFDHQDPHEEVPHEHGEEIPHEGGEEEHGNELHWNFSPFIFVNGDRYKILINLKEQCLEGQCLEKSISLEDALHHDGYLVIERGIFEFGGGGTINFPLENGLTPGVGLFPSVGVSIYTERYSHNHEAAKNIPKIKFPTNANALHDWSEGDLMVYTKKAGITFFAQGEFSGLFFGVGYHARGEWRVSLKKGEKGKIEAAVSKVKLHSLSSFAGIEFASISTSLFGGEDKTFSFEFDLDSKSGQENFNEFLKGNFKFTKNFVEGKTLEGVTCLSESQTNFLGKGFGARMAIPFLANLNFSKSMVNSFSQIQDFKGGEKVENTMAVYSRSLETAGVLSRRTADLIMFAASHQELLHNEKHKSDGHSFTTANFKWMFSRLRVKSHVFQRELEELKRITGLWKSLDFSLPQDNLGYVKLEFDGMFSSKGTERLLKDGPRQNLFLIAKEKIDKFFQTDSDPSKICKFREKVDSCKRFILKSTEKVLRKISKKLKAMKIYSKEKNWKELSETYAELGKEALTNQFSFQTFLDLLGKKNYSFDFKVSGEKIKTIHINEFKEDIPLDLGLNY